MTVRAGTRLGPYEIAAPLGAGGMGEVYRARDTRLDRAVAIKVLPESVAGDPAFLERFEREARVISSLNHPHICALYDVGHESGVRFIVMELVDGESLATRLSRGPLPMAEALRYAVQIADALSRAHRQGIVHRDLKPANVMITKQGAKLLDFGLARVDAGAAAAAGASLAPTAERSLTAAGTILGTFQYMAPEQLEGREADARTDIFAFGALLYEMVTGTRAFGGKSQASLIASIMSNEPAPISTVQPMTPPALDRVVRLCLAKDPDDRWQTAQDLTAELKWIADGGSQVAAPAGVVSRRKSRERWAWGAAAVFALLAAGAAARLLMLPALPRPEPTHFSITGPKGITLSWPRISPDGRTVAFVGADAQGVPSIWLRRMDSVDLVRLEGTENVTRPFWSADSRYLAFFARGQLKKIAAAGGPSQLICELANGADGAWSPAGVILFDGHASDPIWRVPDSGGVPTVAVKPRERGVGVGWPSFLPDGRHFLFTNNDATGMNDLLIGSLDGPETTVLTKVQSRAEYAAGYIFYVAQQTLMARPFSATKLAFTGEPFPVTDRMQTQALGLANFSLSRAGDLSYMSEAQQQVSRLAWVDRSGREVGGVSATGLYREMELSPDGARLAVAIDKNNAYDLWVMDLKRSTLSRLTFGPSYEGWPIWSPDSSFVAYAATEQGTTWQIRRKLASGGGTEEIVYSDQNISLPSDWSLDGKRILAESITQSTDNSDVIAVPADKAGVAAPLTRTPPPLGEGNGRFSPDGRWVAYASNESGRYEVYLQSFPPSGAKWQLSTDGGRWAMWRGDGKEIFYSTRDDTLYAVPMQFGSATVDAGAPVKLFQHRLNHIGVGARNRWVVTRDGQRFLLNLPVESQTVTGADVILNWTNGLKR